METVAIIPARGGSKGIPNKNIMDFCGKPLLAWSIEQAFSGGINDVYVTSDSTKILDIAIKYGAHAIVRPDDISGDHATSESAITHALGIIEKYRNRPDAICFMQCTSPIRTGDEIRSAIAQLGTFDSIFSACALDDYLVWTRSGPVNYNPYNRGMRQDREPLYLENGSFYVIKADLLLQTGCRIAENQACILQPYYTQFEIDEPKDVEVVEFFFRKYILN